MTTPRRYNYTESDGVQGIGWVTEENKGVFVTYQDYLALQTELDLLKKKLARLNKSKLEWRKKKMEND